MKFSSLSVHCAFFFLLTSIQFNSCLHFWSLEKPFEWLKRFDGNAVPLSGSFVVERSYRKCNKLIMLKYKYCRSSVTPEPTPRSLSNHHSPGHSFKGSTSSLSSSTDGMSLRRKKKKAPAPPVPIPTLNVVETSMTKVRFVQDSTSVSVLQPFCVIVADTFKHS